MAYSSIVNISFCLLSIYHNTLHGLYSGLFYMGVYLFLTLGFFGVALMFYKAKTATPIFFIKDLRAIYSHSPFLSYVIMFICFSFAGIPPLAGFFGKLSVFICPCYARV
jgi:NADH-quinone oxidoreductase subunit N